MTSSSSSFPSSSKAFSTSKLYEVIKGVIRGREMPFPEQRADPCNSGNIYPSCPIVKGEKYQFKAWFEVKPFYPPVSAPTLLMAQRESGNQFPLLLTNNYHCSFVPPLPPPRQISIKVKYSLTDPTGQKVACVQVSTKIVDPNPKGSNSQRARNKSKALRNKVSPSSGGGKGAKTVVEKTTPAPTNNSNVDE